MKQIIINDETLNGKILNRIEFDWNEEFITLKDLIAERVKSEVTSHNRNSDKVYRGLVIPKEAEKILNGFKLKISKEIDIEKQVYVALDGFMKNAYFVLVDDKQVEDLDEKLIISNYSKIAFVKLTPLIGG